MKRIFLLQLFALLTTLCLQAQVTQINSNRSLLMEYPLNNNKAIFSSNVDQTIWATDGTTAGTIQLSNTITYDDALGSISFLNGKFIFSGSSAAQGEELYITDGTPAGTVLLKDINPGPLSSSPGADNAVLLNGYLYFTAQTVLEGRELWRTDGTAAGTTLVKDIVPGPLGSNLAGSYQLFSTGTYLLFTTQSLLSGEELWRSDGTSNGTILLKDINTTNANPVGITSFSSFNNLVLFTANDGVHGEETWKTDGTTGGTVMLKDINPGPGNGLASISFGLEYMIFNGRAYFNADDGVNGIEIWSTDGINTTLLKDIEPGADSSLDIVSNAVVIGNRFIFPSTNYSGTRFQLWESDGTTGGTKLFKDFDGGNIPFLFPAYNYSGQDIFSQSLFQGNKFFFLASTAAEGYELWVSDGTVANTHIVKDINAGPEDGLMFSSYLYTSTGIFFNADDGTNGMELWKSDGTTTGTVLVADIASGDNSSDPAVEPFMVNGKILFQANNGDAAQSDLYAVDGIFSPLPVSLADFTAALKSGDALLEWHTMHELNSRDFTVQRSYDGLHFRDIGKVAALNTSANRHGYSFIDANIINSGKSIVYYRLVSTDMDGRSSMSAVITLRLKGTSQWTMQLLSNPVPGDVKVLLTGVEESIQLSILDMSGKRLYSGTPSTLNGQLSLPAANLPKGAYILVAESSRERRSIQFLK